jgi:hypothetical protein
MPKFKVTPDQAAGMERAAQWHDEVSAAARASLADPSLPRGLFHEYENMAQRHSLHAMELRMLVKRDQSGL